MLRSFLCSYLSFCSNRCFCCSQNIFINLLFLYFCLWNSQLQTLVLLTFIFRSDFRICHILRYYNSKMYNQKTIIILILLLVGSFSFSCTVTGVPSVEIANLAVVCVTVNYTSSSTPNGYLEYYFKTTIDEFSSLNLKNLATTFSSAGTVTSAVATVYFQNSNVGTQFSIIDTTNSIQRHFVSTVINLSSGALSETNGIVGDNFCDGSCICHNEECFQSSTGGYGTTDCTFYISWAGDDINGKSFLSSSMRLSRFSLYSASSVYEAVKTDLGY